MAGAGEDDEEIYPPESFFLNDSYSLKRFTYGSTEIDVYCLQSSSTDYDLTGQMIWPGAEHLNDFLVQHPDSFKGFSVLELGSGVGLTGILCALYCQKIVMTDHNDKVLEVLQRNIDLQQTSSGGPFLGSKDFKRTVIMNCEKLEWGNKEHLQHILEKHPEGFDIILGADICYQQGSLSFLFETVGCLLTHKLNSNSKFILSYVSRARSIDDALWREVKNHGLQMAEIEGTRTQIHGIYEAALYEVRPL